MYDQPTYIYEHICMRIYIPTSFKTREIEESCDLALLLVKHASLVDIGTHSKLKKINASRFYRILCVCMCACVYVRIFVYESSYFEYNKKDN